MFDPLTNVGAEPQSKRAAEPEWRAILPVPEGASSPPARHPKLGPPAMLWEYRDAAGQLLYLRCRFNLPGGGKDYRPLSFCEHKRWGRQWRWKAPPAPRPLFGLDRLASHSDAPVLLCEGEKAANAAGELVSDHVAIASPDGSKNAKGADWTALAGRRVVIWPDADAPGQGYVDDVLDLLGKLSPAPNVAVVTPPAGVAEGWDAADALAEGWTAEHAAELIAAAAPASASRAAAGGGRKPAARDWLLGLIDDAELWRDFDGVAYVTIAVDGRRENHRITSRDFKNWLVLRAHWAGVVLGSEAIELATRLAEALALARGPCHSTWRRVAEHEGSIYLDLGCPKWRAVEIAVTGWRVVEKVPVKFLRSRGMRALPEPEAGETIELLREFINCESDSDFRLILAWLAAAFRPVGPFPVLVINGESGAAKSSGSKLLRELIDPFAAPIRRLPKDERDFLISAQNSWVQVFDNLSGMPGWVSDVVCALATGTGLATRKLHSDDEETYFEAQRPIVLNGIPDLATREDLASRAVLINLVKPAKYREDREYWEAANKARPLILGALLDAIAAGLRHQSTVSVERLSRMAAFVKWGEACAPGFGWEPGEFLRDYEENRSDAVAAAAEASPLLPLIEAVLGRTGLPATGFDGTASELLEKLNDVAGEPARRARWYPNTASQLGGALRRVASLLRPRGIELHPYLDRDKKRTRRLILRCVSEAVYEELHARVMGQRRTPPPPDWV